MIAVLGGGIAGISAGYHLSLENIENKVYEARSSWGGLLDNFTIGEGFLFDYFVHLSFTDTEYVKDLFAKSTPFIKHYPESINYYKGQWLKHPAQNNLSPLSTEEKVKIIVDFINKPGFESFENYEQWLVAQFGEYFAQNFPMKYTRKYWTREARDMDVDWVNKRFSLPPLNNLLEGAFEQQETNFYYAKEMRYPESGGFKSFMNVIAEGTDIEVNKKAVSVDLKAKRIDFEDGSFCHFENLFSSIPLDQLIKIMKDVPSDVREAAAKLNASSGQLVSLGFNRPDVPPKLWMYIYDEEIEPARAYSPSIKSPNNVPAGMSSLQFETYFSKFRPKRIEGYNLVEHIVEKGEEMKLWSADEVVVSDYREVKYANVVYDLDRASNLKIVNAYLDDMGVNRCGRFGEWEYFWSDQSLMSAKNAVEKFVHSHALVND